MFTYPTVFVDIETTGGSYRNSRVLEVAAIRYENGEITAQYSTLINPETYIPTAITRLTGITEGDVVGQPVFNDVADELLEIMDGAVFVAHNVRFDYSFLKMEFARAGIDWSPRLLCTVRLSRTLYADQKGHSLAVLIERHNIPVSDRHRALEDAKAILTFSQIAHQHHGQEVFDAAVAKQLKSQSLPPHLDESELTDIPNVPGVYIFKDETHAPIYVGKSVTLKKRIMSHFTDPASKELKISQHIYHIETIATGSELAALILESRLIKQLKPTYNRMLRRVSHYAMLQKIDVDGYSSVSLRSGSINESTDLSKVYGLYPTRTKAKQRMVELTQTFQLCPKLIGLENTKNACFSYSLGKCKGACIGKESRELYNRRFELALEHTRLISWPYKTPIVIPINQTGEAVVIDNWIIKGYMDENGELIGDVDEPTFDVDEYKIAKRFIRENQSFIQPYVA